MMVLCNLGWVMLVSFFRLFVRAQWINGHMDTRFAWLTHIPFILPVSCRAFAFVSFCGVPCVVATRIREWLLRQVVCMPTVGILAAAMVCCHHTPATHRTIGVFVTRSYGGTDRIADGAVSRYPKRGRTTLRQSHHTDCVSGRQPPASCI